MLSRAARNWLVFAIVWGSILLVAYVSIFATVGFNNATTTVDQYNTVVNDYNSSANALKSISSPQTCMAGACLHAASLLHKFDSDLAAMNLPSNAQGPAQAVQSDLTQLTSVFTELANSANAQAYNSTAQRSNLETLLTSLQNDTNNLLSALRSSIL